jgi:hypothetical protein
VWGGIDGEIAGTIDKCNYIAQEYHIHWDNGRDNNSYVESDLELITEHSSKKMKLSEYKKIIKVGDKLKINWKGKISEIEVAKIELTHNQFYALSNETRFDGGWHLEEGTNYKYSFCSNFSDSIEVELISDKVFTKKRKAYVEITKEVGKIYISLKIPSEIEEFFKGNAGGETQVSEAWFSKGGGVPFYKQPKELDKKLVELDSYIFSDYGSGLIKGDKINVAVLRSVGVSKGIKIHSEGFSGFTNAELQDYVKRLGMYIKTLWESNVSTTKIKSVITFEL